LSGLAARHSGFSKDDKDDFEEPLNPSDPETFPRATVHVRLQLLARQLAAA
jgi:hypothetical protein